MARPTGNKPQPGKPPSKHSRAVRRATSPSIDTDKSLKAAQPPPKPLGIHHGAGVSKRKAKQKPLSHAQRQRREKGMARAEAVMDQMERKVDRSRKKEKAIRGRSTAWEDINQDAGDQARGRQKLVGEEEEWEDVENVVMGGLGQKTETEDPEDKTSEGIATAEHATEATAMEESTTEAVGTETTEEAPATEEEASVQEEAPPAKDPGKDELEVAI